jgi:hypothetical protein
MKEHHDGRQSLPFCNLYILVQQHSNEVSQLGKDVFKVIMTIFGADKSKGDVIAIVSVINGEASKVKFLETGTLLAYRWWNTIPYCMSLKL